MVRIEIGTLRQRIRNRSFRGVVFDQEDIDRLVEYFRPAFFRGARNQKERENISAVLRDSSRKVAMPDVVWSGFFLQEAPYRGEGPQDPTEVMIRIKIDMKTPLKDYRAQVERALDTLLHDKRLKVKIMNFILAERRAFFARKTALWSAQSFFDRWFRFIFGVTEDELRMVLTAGPRAQKKWEKHFPTAAPYLTRLPDHVILAITLRLLDEIECAPDDPDTLKGRLERWKKEASAR